MPEDNITTKEPGKRPRHKPFKPKYTTQDILGLYRVRYNDEQEGRVRFISNEIRSLCRLSREPRIPEQYAATTKSVKTPFARDAAHRISSSLLAKSPVVHVVPKNTEHAEYRAAAATCERADMALKEYLNKERDQDIDYNLAYQLVRDGGSVLKVQHRPEAWANFPTRIADEGADELLQRQADFKKGVSIPFLWKDVDRQSIVYEQGEYGDEWIIEYAEYAKPFLAQRYGMEESGSKRRLIDPKRPLEGRPMPEGLKTSATGITTKVEFFDDDEWHVIVDGSAAPGWPKPNPYAPYLPYFRAQAFDEESLLYSLLFLVPRLDELLTMVLNYIYINSYPIPVLGWNPSINESAYAGPIGNSGESSDGAIANNPNYLTFEPGKVYDTPWGRTLAFLEAPPIGPDLDKLVSVFKTMIDTAGVPSILKGVAGSGDSGYLGAQLRAAAQMAFKLAASALQRQQEKAFEFTHWMISHIIRQTVYVLGWSSINPKTGMPAEKAERTWLGLSPEEDHNLKHIADLSKIATVDIKYRVQLPTDEQAMLMMALQATNARKPLYDRRTALERLMQEDDPDTIIDRIYVEEAEESPEQKAVVIAHALEEAGIKKEQPALPPGIPAAGGMPEQGAPAESGPPQLPPGAPGQPGVNMPVVAPPPRRSRGIPGRAGGRAAGAYPGQPGGARR